MASKARPVVNNENALNAPTSQSNVSVEQYLNMECEKLITQLGKIADERIEEFLAKARMTRTELEKTLLASKQ